MKIQSTIGKNHLCDECMKPEPGVQINFAKTLSVIRLCLSCINLLIEKLESTEL